MDQNIINQLIRYSDNYKIILNNFQNKNDAASIFELEYNEYFTPIMKFLLPDLAQRLLEHPEDSLSNYLPYISTRYHQGVTIEVALLQKNVNFHFKKQAKYIEESFNSKVLTYKSKSEELKNQFIQDFLTIHLPVIQNISKLEPATCLSLIAKLRNPQIQRLLLKEPILFVNLSAFTKGELIKKPWDMWVDKLFTYPRTKDLQEYFNKWICRDRLHIKMCSEYFDRETYEQLKISLKSQEKSAEKQFMQDQQNKENS